MDAAGQVRFTVSAASDAAALETDWRDLEQRAAPPFFLSWNWIGCWIREVGLTPTVLTGRIDGRIVLLAVLAPSARRDVLPVTIRGLHLHMTGEPGQDVITIEYNGFLVERSLIGRIEAAAIAYLLGGQIIAGERRDELHLKNVPADMRRYVTAAGCQFRALQHKSSWRVDLTAIRAAGRPYLDGLSANTRQQIRRSMRLYETRGPLTAVRANNVAEAMQFLDGLKALHQATWTGRGEPGAFAFPFFERFQRRLIETCLPHGTVELVRVAAGDEIIGFVYNLVYRGHVYAYQTGIRYESDARLKPGLVSHALCIDRHLADGSRKYDFMAGEARYKASLGQRGPDMVYLLALRQTWPLQLETTLHAARRRMRFDFRTR